jgi:hypothetical protein
LAQSAHQLREQKRVAARTPAHQVRQLRGGRRQRVAAGRAQEPFHRGDVELLQGHSDHSGLARQGGEDLARRLGGMEVGVAIGGDDQQAARAARADDVAQEQKRLPPGPLKVLEDEKHGSALAGDVDPTHDRFEEAVAVDVDVGGHRRWSAEQCAALRNEAGQLEPTGVEIFQKALGRAGLEKPAQRLREGLKRQSSDLPAAALENGAGLLLHALDQLFRQPRLADARLPGDQSRELLAGGGARPSGEQRLDLGGASGQRIAPAGSAVRGLPVDVPRAHCHHRAHGGDEAVAVTMKRLDRARGPPAVADRPARQPHTTTESVVADELPRPQAFEQLAATHHPVPVLEQTGEKVERLRLDRYVCAPPAQGARPLVELAVEKPVLHPPPI